MFQALLAVLMALVSVTGPTAATAPPGGPSHVFPVSGRTHFGRAHHDYPATDIWARCGARYSSPVAGTVLEVGRRDHWRPRTDRGRDRGGLFVSVRGDDGVRYYGSHLRAVRAGLRPGDRVRAGELLGRVGRSGNARYVGCQVHFGISPVCRGTGQWWVRRGVLAPYPFLRSWRRGGDRSPWPAVRAWHARHGCPSQVPGAP